MNGYGIRGYGGFNQALTLAGNNAGNYIALDKFGGAESGTVTTNIAAVDLPLKVRRRIRRGWGGSKSNFRALANRPG